MGTAGAVPAAARAVDRMRAALRELLAGRSISGNIHRQLATVRRPYLEIQVSEIGPGQNAEALQQLGQGGVAVAGPEYPEFTTMSFIAHFVEVHVEPRTRRVRMPRAVSIADCGRGDQPAHGDEPDLRRRRLGLQFALREATRSIRAMAAISIATSPIIVVAVNADIGEIEVGLINQPDPQANSMESRASAKWFCRERRRRSSTRFIMRRAGAIRHMPVRIEDLL